MKTLKFTPNLVKQIKNGKKTTTWRLFDDKNLQVGDELTFINNESKEKFAEARIIDLKEKRLGFLDETDFEGHQKYESNEKMYSSFKKFYPQDINENTLVKIVKFEIIKFLN